MEPNTEPTSPPEDLALSALADARQLARGRPIRGVSRRRAVRGTGGAAPRGGYSGPGPDETDPQRIGLVFAGHVSERGWQRPLAEARVFADWSALVGPEVAAHCSPTSLRAGELKVTAQSTAWATQLRLLAATVLARLVGELGPEVVSKLVITGPVGPSWRHGGFSVRGSRGPRDTYG